MPFVAHAPRYRHRGSSLGLPALATTLLIHQIEQGLPYRTLEAFSAASGLNESTLAAALEMPPRTLARRKVAGRLDAHESERLLRLAIVFEQAVALFEGNTAAAARWLLAPRSALGGQTPLAYTRTELGAREVERLIERLEDGVFS